MPDRVRIVGLHPVEGHPEVHLVELEITNPPFRFDFCDLTQEDPTQPPENWQLPYDDRCLELSPDKERYGFFFHHLNLTRPLNAPFGQMELPAVTPMPDHLKKIGYEAP